jgi:hypothetical protein
MHPLDLVKTRLQIGGGHFNGLGDCFRKTLQKEGFSGFYKGILPPILAETPKRATKFLTFAQYTKVLHSVGGGLPAWAVGCSFWQSNLKIITHSYFQIHPLAGFFSGLTEAVVVCPFEVVKVQLQSEHNIALNQQKSTAAVAREIVKTRGLGLNGLYMGLGATLYRHGVWNAVYFGLYHNMRFAFFKLKM